MKMKSGSSAVGGGAQAKAVGFEHGRTLTAGNLFLHKKLSYPTGSSGRLSIGK